MRLQRTIFSALGSLAALSLLSACAGGGSTPAATAPGSSTQQSTAHALGSVYSRAAVPSVLPPDLMARIHPGPPASGPGWMSPQVRLGKTVYVSGYFCNCVEIYSQKGSNQQSIGQITKGLLNPEGMAISTAHDLYVANAGGSVISVYHRGQTKPFEKLQDPGGIPVDVALDSNGTVYAANIVTGSSAPGNVVYYTSGSKNPSGTLTDPNMNLVFSVGSDHLGNRYVGYTNVSGVPQMDEFPSGSSTPINLGLQLTSTVGGIQFDNANDIVVADGGQIATFPQTQKTPSSLFGSDALFIAFNKSAKHIYATDAYHAQIEEYAFPSGNQLDVIKTGWSGANPPFGVATDPAQVP